MSVNINLKGFQNLGNTCYLNSALQAILASNVMNTSLIIYLKENRQMTQKISLMMTEYCRVLLDLFDDSPSPIYNPIRFKHTLDIINPWFRGSSQHDANELLLYLVNEFIDNTEDKGFVQLIKNLLFGKYKQYIYCNECKHINENYFNFLDVSLPIPESKNPDLEDCFMKFAQYCTLSGNDMWNCPDCKKKVIAHKKMEIMEVPNIAVFTLNRFKGTIKNNTPVRLYHNIELDGKKLKLISTVNHYGSVNSGHYVAHVTRGDTWYRADDSTISQIDQNSILNDPSVYMAIYQISC